MKRTDEKKGKKKINKFEAPKISVQIEVESIDVNINITDDIRDLFDTLYPETVPSANDEDGDVEMKVFYKDGDSTFTTLKGLLDNLKALSKEEKESGHD